MAEEHIKMPDKEVKSCMFIIQYASNHWRYSFHCVGISALPDDTQTTDDVQCTTIPSKSDDNVKDTNNNDEDDYMWMDFDVDFTELLQDLNSQELLQSPINKAQHEGNTPETTQHPTTYQCDNAHVEYNLDRFGGFMTAGSKKNLNTNSEARNKAIALFQDTASSLQKDTSKYSKSTHDDTEQPSVISPVNLTTTTSELGEKRPLDDDQEPPPEFKYESILSEYGGFKMGSGRAGITVSAEAKRQAVALFNASETTRDLTQSQSPIRDNTSSQFGSSSSSSNTSGSPLSKMNCSDSQSSTVKSPLSRPKYSAPAINAITLAHTSPPRSPLPTKESPKTLSPVRRRRQQPNIAFGKIRPFKSPIIKDKLEYTKAAVNNQTSSAIRGKGPSVFSLQGNQNG